MFKFVEKATLKLVEDVFEGKELPIPMVVQLCHVSDVYLDSADCNDVITGSL